MFKMARFASAEERERNVHGIMQAGVQLAGSGLWSDFGSHGYTLGMFVILFETTRECIWIKRLLVLFLTLPSNWTA
jgi:hypothetical protein